MLAWGIHLRGDSVLVDWADFPARTTLLAEMGGAVVAEFELTGGVVAVGEEFVITGIRDYPGGSQKLFMTVLF